MAAADMISAAPASLPKMNAPSRGITSLNDPRRRILQPLPQAAVAEAPPRNCKLVFTVPNMWL
jgi:hypothetical protein